MSRRRQANQSSTDHCLSAPLVITFDTVSCIFRPQRQSDAIAFIASQTSSWSELVTAVLLYFSFAKLYQLWLRKSRPFFRKDWISMSYKHARLAARFQHQYTEVKCTQDTVAPAIRAHLAVTDECRNPSAFSEFYICLQKHLAMAM